MKKNDIPDDVFDPAKIIADFKKMLENQNKNKIPKEDDVESTLNFLMQMDPAQKEQLVNEFNDENLGPPVDLKELEKLSVEEIKAAHKQRLKNQEMLEASELLNCFDDLTTFEKEVILEKMNQADFEPSSKPSNGLNLK